ncbi:PhzF family phenazine biosynthesis protein, partial [Providencia rettgeri]
MKFNFKQPTVFSVDNLKGKPLAVVMDADALTYEQMTQFARWNNVSETAYLLKPTIDGADYRVRIFTINGEIPFAGQPRLGSCYVWLRGYKQHDKTPITQQCEAGLVTIKRVNGRLAFMAPPIIKVTELVD